ncbi:MAG: FAD-binding oxidoreductase [Bacillota bacterium]|nr:FAD-binding oxidoreductase [Bacillota bacterium]
MALTKKKYEVIVIGAGISGACTAFELAKRGVTDVLLVDKQYVASGATGRCAAGIRQQFGFRLNAEVAIDCTEIWTNLNKYTGYKHDCGVVQCGYMLLAYTEAELRTFTNNLILQHELGINSEELDIPAIKKILPGLNTEGVLGATWNAEDGTADPFHGTLAFARGAERMGVDVAPYTEVLQIKTLNGEVCGVETNRGYIETKHIINCANSWAPILAAQVGDEIPIKNERHQIFVTEPVGMLGPNGLPMPMVLTFCKGTYSKQTAHGSLLLGIDEEPEHSYNSNATWDFAEKCCGLHCEMFPMFRKLRIVRQWAGFYDISPDSNTIIHFSENAKGLVSLCGLSGHGFLLGPRLGILLANNYCGLDDPIDIKRFSLDRYKDGGELLSEPLCV